MNDTFSTPTKIRDVDRGNNGKLGFLNQFVIVNSNLDSKFATSILVRFKVQRRIRVDDRDIITICFQLKSIIFDHLIKIRSKIID